jgi:hypothetical protein
MLLAEKGMIHVDDYEDMKKSYNIMCKCGHTASSHGFYIPGHGTYLPGTVHVSQCCLCGNAGTHVVDGKLEFVCERFDPEENNNASISS